MDATQYLPSVTLTATHFETLERLGRIKLNPEHRREIRKWLREYEYICHLKERGVGSDLLPNVRKLGERLEQAIRIIESLPMNPGHIWPFLATDANVDDYDEEIRRLKDLRRSCAEFGKKYTRGHVRDFYLDSLLEQLESTFMRAGGRSSSISKTRQLRGGRFLSFLRAAIGHLPEPYNPLVGKKDPIGARWERILEDRKNGVRRMIPWVGGPHPILARIASRSWLE
jgi:hypothetical protein